MLVGVSDFGAAFAQYKSRDAAVLLVPSLSLPLPPSSLAASLPPSLPPFPSLSLPPSLFSYAWFVNPGTQPGHKHVCIIVMIHRSDHQVFRRSSSGSQWIWEHLGSPFSVTTHLHLDPNRFGHHRFKISKTPIWVVFKTPMMVFLGGLFLFKKCLWWFMIASWFKSPDQ